MTPAANILRPIRNLLWTSAIKFRDFSERLDDWGDSIDRLNRPTPTDYRCHRCGRWNSVCPH